MAKTGKILALLGGLIVVLGVALGFVLDDFSLWYSQVQLGNSYLKASFLPLDLVKSDGQLSFGPWTFSGSDTATSTSLMIIYILILAGGALTLIGGLGTKKVAFVGVAVTLLALFLFMGLLPSILEDVGIDQVGDESIYFTYQKEVTVIIITYKVTQVLWLGWWFPLVGAVLGLIGAASMES